jgi:hypothetical protein
MAKLFIKLIIHLFIFLAFIRCAGPNGLDQNGITNFKLSSGSDGIIAVRAVARDYSTSSVILIDPTDLSNQSGDFMVDRSDTAINCGEGVIYHVGRYQMDRVTQLDFTGRVNWQKSIRRSYDRASSNPYQVLELDTSRALVIRFGSNTQLIIDRQSGEVIGELDLSEFNEGDLDGVVEASVGWIKDNDIYLILNRINRQGNQWNFELAPLIVRYDVPSLSYQDHFSLNIRNVQSRPVYHDNNVIFTSVGSMLDGSHRGVEVINFLNERRDFDQRYSKLVEFSGVIYGLEYVEWNRQAVVSFKYDNGLVFESNPLEYISDVVDMINTKYGLLVITTDYVYLYDGKKINRARLGSELSAASLIYCQ